MGYTLFMEIIDGHTHIFPPELILQREKIADKDRGFRLLYGNKSAPMADGGALLRYMENENVAMAAICSFPFEDPGLVVLMNDYILEFAGERTGIVPLVAIDPRYGEWALAELERTILLGAAGVGEVAFYGGFMGRDELCGLEGVARYLGEKNKILMLHMNEQVGHEYAGKTAINLQEAVQFVGRHRNLRIIFAHLGGGLCFYEFMPEIRQTFQHVYYDTAATPLLYSSHIYEFIERFMAEKTIFGTDYPLLTPVRYLKAMAQMGEETKKKILYENGEKLFAPR